MKLNNYQNAWASMLAITKKFAAAYPQYGLTPFDFDENVNESEFPSGNLIGVYQFDYTEDDGLIYVRLMFPLSFSDTFEFNEAVGNFVNFVSSQTRHDFINYGNAVTIGHMVALNELAVSPVSKTTNRQFKFVLQGFAFDRSVSGPAI